MAARRAIGRSIPALCSRSALPSLRHRPLKTSDPTSIAKRRLHPTAQQFKPAAATAVSTADNYPVTHEQIAKPIDTHNFLDNEFVPSKASTWIDLFDPATNNLVTRVPQSTDEELKAAVDSAEKAFPAWRATS